MIRYQVFVTNQPMQDFTVISSAIDYATRHVYLSWENGQLAIQALLEGKPFNYSYGMFSVDIIPVEVTYAK